MLNRKIVLALAAIATMTTAALVPTSASAMRGGFARAAVGHSPFVGGNGLRSGGAGGILRNNGLGGGHNKVILGGGNVRGGCTGNACIGVKPVCSGIRCLPKLPGIPIGWHPHPHPWPVFAWHHEHWGVGVGVGGYDAPVAVADTTVAAPAATTAPCNCLTKQYLPDGSVMFQDLCTKEAALATPAELKAQADGIAPTAQ
jgi:hypothetical protein